MATGDNADILKRIKAALAPWFGNSTTSVLDSELAAAQYLGNLLYSQYGNAKLQSRIKTATEYFLDLISADFYGNTLPRGQQESDASYLNRIIAQLLVQKANRQGMSQALINLTGRTPKLFEPRRPADTGGYSSGGCGYGVAGGWGNLQIPYNGLIDAYRPLVGSVPGVNGYTFGAAGYGVGYNQYISVQNITNQVTDAQIYAIVDQTKVAGTQVWVRISS